MGREEEAGQEAEVGQEEEVGLPTRCWRRRPARPSPPRCPNAKWRPGSGRWRPVGLPELLGGHGREGGCNSMVVEDSRARGSPPRGKGPLYPHVSPNSMALEDPHPSPVLQATLMPTLSSHIPRLYGFGGSPGLASPPSNPSARSIPSTATTLWLWRSSRPTQSSKQSQCPLYPHVSPNFMTLEDLQA